MFRLKNIDLGAIFGKKFKYWPEHHPFRIINMGHVSEASAVHHYQKSGKFMNSHHFG